MPIDNDNNAITEKLDELINRGSEGLLWAVSAGSDYDGLIASALGTGILYAALSIKNPGLPHDQIMQTIGRIIDELESNYPPAPEKSVHSDENDA